jgi:hypothetical protein
MVRAHPIKEDAVVRRHLLIATIAALFIALVASPASAKTSAQVAKLAGDMNGTTTWAGRITGCDFVDQHFDATYQGRPGAGTVELHIHACEAAPVPTVGTFRIATRHGTVDGTLVGSLVIGAPVVFTFDLTPTSGTGVYRHPSGTLHFVARWFIGDPSGSPFSATVSVN